MSGLLRHFLGFILLVATVGLATCQSMVKAEPAAAVADAVSTRTESRS